MHCTVSDTVPMCICLMAPVLIFFGGGVTDKQFKRGKICFGS